MRRYRELRHAHPPRPQSRGTTLSQFNTRAKGNRDTRKDRDNMLPNTFVTRNANYVGNSYEEAMQQTVCSQTSGPGCVMKHSQYPSHPGPANTGEIYGLALGTCFLLVLMGWILFVGIRTGINMLRRTTKRNRDVDPEGGIVLEPQPPEKSHSFLPSMGSVVTGEFIQSARQKSMNVAAGLRKDIVSIRRRPHPPVDEEAAMGSHTEGVGTNADDSFLHQRHRAMAVLPA
ncbi:hypothetical protein F4818DRAFT_172833 [Hypoxylon cercidicola]|nr:hypothetical protein F4818DRAFT_172833 [Hypoxylon cercidicola]